MTNKIIPFPSTKSSPLTTVLHMQTNTFCTPYKLISLKAYINTAYTVISSQKTVFLNQKTEERKMKCEMTEEMKATYEELRSLATKNAVVVFSVSSCCMCHVVKKLLFGLGVGPTIVEMDQVEGGKEMQEMLEKLIGGDGVKGTNTMVVPAVFVGGKYLGGVGTVMSYHISGTLVPLLKKAGGLWL